MKLVIWRFELKWQDAWVGGYWRIREESGQRFLDLWLCAIPFVPLYSSWRLS